MSDCHHNALSNQLFLIDVSIIQSVDIQPLVGVLGKGLSDGC